MHLVDGGVPVLAAPRRVGVQRDGVDIADALAAVVGDEREPVGALHAARLGHGGGAGAHGQEAQGAVVVGAPQGLGHRHLGRDEE